MPTISRSRAVREARSPASVPLFRQPDWAERLPWLVQGITARGEDGRPFDLAVFGAGDPDAAWERWWRLARAAEMDRVVLGRQVHGRTVRFHGRPGPGMLLTPDTDGHATATPGVLLAVTVADCVPVFVVDPETRAAALLHAGWRGLAAGIVGRGVDTLRDRMGAAPDRLLLHAGPAICGECYEVGPEVHRALGRDDPGEPAPVDLRALVAERARGRGLRADAITISEHCTLCGDGRFFSHRGGDRERQAAVVGIRTRGAA